MFLPGKIGKLLRLLSVFHKKVAQSTKKDPNEHISLQSHATNVGTLATMSFLSKLLTFCHGRIPAHRVILYVSDEEERQRYQDVKQLKSSSVTPVSRNDASLGNPSLLRWRVCRVIYCVCISICDL